MDIDRRTQKTSLSIPRDILAAIDYVAHETGLSRSNLVARFLLAQIYELDSALDKVEDHGKQTGEKIRLVLGLQGPRKGLKNIGEV